MQLVTRRSLLSITVSSEAAPQIVTRQCNQASLQPRKAVRVIKCCTLLIDCAHLSLRTTQSSKKTAITQRELAAQSPLSGTRR